MGFVSRLCALPLLAYATLSLAADEVTLRNGDRLSGEIVGKSGNAIVIRTGYAGDVTVRWSEVVSVRAETPVRAVLAGSDEPVRGRLVPGADGRVELVPEKGEPTEVDLKEIAFLNPKPYETAQGVDYKGHALLSAAYTRGNVESDRLYSDAELTARARQYRYSLSGKIERRAESTAGVTASNWLFGGNYDWFSDPENFRYVRSSIENDRIKDIERRFALGAGLGLQIVETERANVSLRGGLDYVALDRYSGLTERYPAFGWGLNLKYKPDGRELELFHNQEGYWNLRRTDSVTLRSKTGVRMPLIWKVNGVAQLNVDWERRPAPGRKPTDSTLLLGIDYAW
jgi:putative salt-induced outer membrane protein YdiY